MSAPLHVIMPSDVFPPVSGGAGWSAHALARALQARGHRVTAIVPRLAERRVFSSRVDRSISLPTDVLGVSTVDVPYSAPRLPFVANWYRHEWLWPLLRNVIVREALRWPETRGHVVVHAQHVQTLPGAILAGQELDVPVVATVRDHWPADYFATGLHGGRLPYPRNSAASLATDLVARLGPVKGVLAIAAVPYMLRHMQRRQAFLSRVDAVVAVSRYMAGRLPPVVPPGRVHVIPNIVDVAEIERIAAQLPAIDLPEHFVLFVGKLEYNKGAHLLPRVFVAAREHIGAANLPALVVAGSGPLAEELRHEFAAMELPLRILPGWTDHDDVLRLMRRAGVLIFPSAWGEPLSRVPIEASAAGACIAAMATGGTPEIVEDGVSGVLATSAEGLGRALTELLRSPARRDALRAGARRTARERFAPDAVAHRFEELYETTLNTETRRHGAEKR